MMAAGVETHALGVSVAEQRRLLDPHLCHAVERRLRNGVLVGVDHQIRLEGFAHGGERTHERIAGVGR